MRYTCIAARVGGKLAAIVSVVAVVFLVTAAVAGAARATGTFSNSVTFIGDSVTAGFGFCGTEDPAKVECQPNEEMKDSWDDPFDGTNLKKCAPPSPPAPLPDTCSNDNFYGKPWEAGPWKPGPNAPQIAYPFQLAAQQSPVAPASVSDWAVSGATPANWDPKGGEYGALLGRLKQQYVVMTLGGNPLL
ncbi:MAG TPA: hypothetical protein VGH14_11065 [Solirubrobacterales bacterium]|jgi:hypothetical protein